MKCVRSLRCNPCARRRVGDMFNRHMMALARDSRGETQSDLAEGLSVGQGTISKYESGLSLPSDEFVSDMAAYLKYKPGFFYEEGRTLGMPPFHYRKRKKLGVKTLLKIEAEINIRRMHVSKLMRSYEKLPMLKIPEIDRDEYQGVNRKVYDIEDIASHLRDKWMIGSGPIPSVIELIERFGGIVIPCDFGTDLIDAMSQRIDGMPILFFININSPADRMRFTLCHEICHMVLHTLDMVNDEDMEREADYFASALLLPTNEIRPQLRNNFNLRNLANLKSHWKVSMQALAMRASQLELITQNQIKTFWIEMSKMGFRKREPNELPRERPRVLRNMIDYHLSNLGYSKEELATLLHILPEEINKLYGDEHFEPLPPKKERVLQLVK